MVLELNTSPCKPYLDFLTIGTLDNEPKRYLASNRIILRHVLLQSCFDVSLNGFSNAFSTFDCLINEAELMFSRTSMRCTKYRGNQISQIPHLIKSLPLFFLYFKHATHFHARYGADFWRKVTQNVGKIGQYSSSSILTQEHMPCHLTPGPAKLQPIYRKSENYTVKSHRFFRRYGYPGLSGFFRHTQL